MYIEFSYFRAVTCLSKIVKSLRIDYEKYQSLTKYFYKPSPFNKVNKIPM